jgi:hypothetical protein
MMCCKDFTTDSSKHLVVCCSTGMILPDVVGCPTTAKMKYTKDKLIDQLVNSESRLWRRNIEGSLKEKMRVPVGSRVGKSGGQKIAK